MPGKWEFTKDAAEGLRPAITRPRPAGEVTQGTRILRQVFGALALATAVVAGIMTYNRTDSAWPAVFAALIALQIVSRAIPDVITDSKKVRRALYFGLGPGLGTAVFYFSYQTWETYWLSFVLGLFGGAILVGILGPLLFPAIHREEKADSARRWGINKESP